MDDEAGGAMRATADRAQREKDELDLQVRDRQSRLLNLCLQSLGWIQVATFRITLGNQSDSETPRSVSNVIKICN